MTILPTLGAGITLAERLAREFQNIQEETEDILARTEAYANAQDKLNTEYEETINNLRTISHLQDDFEKQKWAEFLAKEASEVKDILANMFSDFGPPVEQGDPLGFNAMEEKILEGAEKVYLAIKSKQEKIAEAAQEFTNALRNMFTDAVVALSEAMGQLLTATGNEGPMILNQFLQTLLGFARQFGAFLIAVGIGIEAFKESLKSLNPVVAIAAGIALVALSSAGIAALQKQAKGMGGQGMAAGGIVPPGFNNDTYPAMLSSGETVIPSPQALPSYGRNQRLTVSLPLRQLVIALEDERERMGRS
jgi:hypothetical protein